MSPPSKRNKYLVSSYLSLRSKSRNERKDDSTFLSVGELVLSVVSTSILPELEPLPLLYTAALPPELLPDVEELLITDLPPGVENQSGMEVY
jgi:hypothetical protein